MPALIALMVANRERGKRYAVRFTGVAALKEAAGTVPAWRRHLPAALFLAALAALALALAKPQRTVAGAGRGASIMLVTDHSRSMLAQDVEPDRMTAAKRAAGGFLDQIPPSIRVGVTTYSDVPDGTQTPTRDHDAIRLTIDNQVADGGTRDRRRAAGRARHARPPAGGRREGAGRDGAAVRRRDDDRPRPRRGRARRRRGEDPIYTIALGTSDATVPNPEPGSAPLPVPPDPETLQAIADASGGPRLPGPQDDQQLSEIYQALGSRLGTRDEEREVTSAFAVAGALLLLGAGAARDALRGPGCRSARPAAGRFIVRFSHGVSVAHERAAARAPPAAGRGGSRSPSGRRR